MLRSLLVGILAVSVAPSCKGGHDAPAVQPGLAVGKVIELDGTVTATRGGKARTLATHDEISGDDVIETNDGRVMIWLTFNNATWDLPPHRKERVGDSTAWKAEKVAQLPAAVQEATISGGRHAEKSAADTRESEAAPKANPAPPPATSEAPTPPSPVAGTIGAQVDPAPPADRAPRVDRAPRTATPPEQAKREENKKAAPPRELRDPRGGGGNPAASPPRMDEMASSPSGGAAVPEIEASPAAQLASHQAELAQCLAGAATLPIKLVVKAGKASIVGAKLSAAQARCFATVAATFKFDEKTTVELTYTVSK